MVDDGLGLGLNSGLDDFFGPKLINGLNRFGWFKPWKATAGDKREAEEAKTITWIQNLYVFGLASIGLFHALALGFFYNRGEKKKEAGLDSGAEESDATASPTASPTGGGAGGAQ